MTDECMGTVNSKMVVISFKMELSGGVKLGDGEGKKRTKKGDNGLKVKIKLV
jgi:hypothetical protein